MINIATVLGLVAERFDGAYNGTKSFLLTLSKWLSVELGPKGVHVQAVLPGATRTEIWERSGQDNGAFPPEMMMGVDDLVDAAFARLRQERDRHDPAARRLVALSSL